MREVAAIERMYTAGVLARETADAFGAGAAHFASVDDARVARSRRRARRRHRARQGLALHADGARRRRADGPRGRGRH